MERFDISDELNEMLGQFISFVPNLIGAILILLIGYFVASFVSKLVARGLQSVRFDNLIQSSAAGGIVSRVIESPSRLAGMITFWLIFLGAVSFAVSVLSLPVLDRVLATIYGYVPNVIGAIIIFLVASTVSTAAATFAQRVMGQTSMGKIVAAVIPAVVMSLAVFMILNQLGVARDIVNILFTAIVGSMALGLALAFGLGGQDVARELLKQAVSKARDNRQTIESEVHSAAKNAQKN